MVAVDTENMGLNNIIRKWYKKFMMAWIGVVKDSLAGGVGLNMLCIEG